MWRDNLDDQLVGPSTRRKVGAPSVILALCGSLTWSSISVAADMPGSTAEYPKADLGYLSYDAAFGVFGGRPTVSASLEAGLRLGDNAFDVQGFLSTSYATSCPFGCVVPRSAETVVTGQINTFAYRRHFFDEKLFLTVGRRNAPPDGELPGERIDGLSLVKQNLDANGALNLADVRRLSFYAPLGGVLSYRVADRIYYQKAIDPGLVSVDSSIFDRLPAGGITEVTFTDGRKIVIPARSSLQSRLLLYAPGTYSFDVSAGTTPGLNEAYAPALRGVGRIGVTSELTLGGGGELTSDFSRQSLDVSVKLPGHFGYAQAGAGGTQLLHVLPGYAGPRSGVSIEAEWQFGSNQLGGDLLVRRNFGLGEPPTIVRPRDAVPACPVADPSFGLSPASAAPCGPLASPGSRALIQSDPIRSQIRASLYAAARGVSLTVNAEVDTNLLTPPLRSVGLRLGGRLYRRATWAIFAQGSKFGPDRPRFDLGLTFSTPLGRSVQANVSVENEGGQTSGDVQVSGARSIDLQNDLRYNARVATDGRAALTVDRDFLGVSAGAAVIVGPVSGVAVAGTLRGGIVFGDGHVVSVRQPGDSLLLLKAPGLPHAEVFDTSATYPKTRLDEAGYAVIANLAPYRSTTLRVSAAKAPIGTMVNGDLIGSVQPGRGYEITLSTRRIHPIRIFFRLPSVGQGLDAYAVIGDAPAPVESDGSFYVEDSTRLTPHVIIVWSSGTCLLTIPATPRADDTADFHVDAGECVVQ